MKILVVGYGYVGQALCFELAQSGHEVIALQRSEPTIPKHACISLLQGDATRASDLFNLPDDVTQIVSTISPDERTEAAYHKAYPLALSCLITRYPQARFLLLSSTAVYDHDEAAEVDDHAQADASVPTAAQMKLAEDLLLNHIPSHDGPLRSSPTLHHIVVRSSGIYGPNRTRLISGLAHHDLTAEAALTWTNRIHRDDLVSIIAMLIEKPNLSGVFNASDPNPCQLKAIADWVRLEPAAQSLPMRGEPVQPRIKNRKIIPARLLTLGYQFKYPSYIEGYSQVLGPTPTDN